MKSVCANCGKELTEYEATTYAGFCTHCFMSQPEDNEHTTLNYIPENPDFNFTVTLASKRKNK